MKRYFSYILIFVSFCYLNLICMDQDQDENRFSICNQIKQIDPDASPAAYFKLAEKLSKNNLSTCACMTYLMQEREKKAIRLITENFISEKTENVVKELLYQQQQQHDSANEKNGIPLTIHCSPSIDPATQASIAEKFSGKYHTTIMPTEEFCSSRSLALLCLDRHIHFFVRRVGDGSNSVEFIVDNPKIGVDSSFKELSPNAKNAALEHEKHHMEASHTTWNSAAGINYVIYGGHKEYTVDEKEAQSKLSRAHEAAADRIPAACNDCKLASDFIHFLSSPIVKTSNCSKKNGLSGHPSTEKRLQWAQRIYNLKLAEQEIKKN